MRTKGILCTLLVVLALTAVLAGPVLSKTTTWTFGADPDTEWLTAGNWDNGVAIADDTIDISSTQVPTNIPVDAGTFNFSISNAVAVTLSDWLNTGATGDVTIPDADAIITTGANVAGNVSVTSKGTLTLSDGTTVAGIMTIDGGFVYLYGPYTGTATVTGLITTDNGAILQVPDVLDVNGGIVVGAGGARIYNNGEIRGCVNAAGNDILWVGTGIITVDEDGTLDLGTDAANDQTVNIAANVTIGDHFTCYGFDGSSGEITGAAKTITVGSGGLTNGGATLDAVGTLNVIVAETPAAFDWAVANSNHSLGTLTVNAATTMTDTVYTTKVAGSAAIAVDARLYVRAMAADFWTNTATHSGSNRFVMYAYTGSHANTALINIGTCEFQVVGFDGTTTTLNGGLTCGVLDLNATAQNLVVNGPLSASGNTTLDDATLTLGSAATHSFGGTITSGSTGILTLAGNVSFGDNVMLAGFGTVAFGSAIIEASGDLTIDGTDATIITNTGSCIFGNGYVLTLDDIDYNTNSSPIVAISCVEGIVPCGTAIEFQEMGRMMTGGGF